MKLKLIILEKTRETGKFVSINKAGVFNFSKDFIEENGIKESMRLDFLQDEESKKDWYFQLLPTGQSAFRSSNKGVAKGLMINCSFIAKKIKESLGYDVDKTLTAPIGLGEMVDGVMTYSIITAAIKKQ
ncbi:hypothetical protein [Flavobacterium sp.]|uniref:hypothetical protein n=1 Tax=Flavobacterium sp. TaxID=239 RepID=UPI0037528E85